MANEKRLIDAYAFYKKFANDIPTITVGEQRYVATWRISDMIADAPTVDAVEVVRCKDCKHWDKDALACDTLPWVNSSEHANWYADDFCSYGERRTE